jgi:hypothetical protein
MSRPRVRKVRKNEIGSPAWIRTTISLRNGESATYRFHKGLESRNGLEKPPLVHHRYTERDQSRCREWFCVVVSALLYLRCCICVVVSALLYLRCCRCHSRDSQIQIVLPRLSWLRTKGGESIGLMLSEAVYFVAGLAQQAFRSERRRAGQVG